MQAAIEISSYSYVVYRHYTFEKIYLCWAPFCLLRVERHDGEVPGSMCLIYVSSLCGYL